MDKYYFSTSQNFVKLGYVYANNKVEALEKIEKNENVEFYDSYWEDNPNAYIEKIEESEPELDEESMRLNATQ